MHNWTKMWRVLSDQSSESDKETERKRSWNGGSRKGGGTVSCYQSSENNQDRRGNLKNRQGNYMLKCLSSESLFQITTSSFHVSDQEVISSKPLVQKVILDPTLMAGQRKYLFPSNGIQSIRWRSDRSLLIFGIYFHHPLKHPQPIWVQPNAFGEETHGLWAFVDVHLSTSMWTVRWCHLNPV